MTAKTKIYIPAPDPVGSRPFENDLFDRDRLADQITNYLEHIQDGCVFAIDAAWGEGKTWFGKNLELYLRDSGHKTIFIDAFENDYVDDAFIVLTSEMLTLINPESGEGKQILQAGKLVTTNLLPIATKIGLNLLGQHLLGKTGLGDSAAETAKGVADASEHWVEEALKHSEKHKKSRDDFKKTLSIFTKAQSKPVIVLIDELDRCRPPFAVQVIERIKHLFDVENLVFILLLNREQLEAAIRGVYGQGIDATEYLGKFVQFSLTLPKKVGNVVYRDNYNRDFAVALAKRYGLPVGVGTDEFLETLSQIATFFELSYRDIERAFILYAMTLENVRGIPPMLSWLILLKLKFPEVFLLVARGESAGHQQAVKILRDNQSRFAGSRLPNVATLAAGLHSASTHREGFEHLDSSILRILSYYPGWSPYADRIIPAICDQIDLAVQR